MQCRPMCAACWQCACPARCTRVCWSACGENVCSSEQMATCTGAPRGGTEQVPNGVGYMHREGAPLSRLGALHRV